MVILNKIYQIMLRNILITVLLSGFFLTTLFTESKAAISDMTYCGGKFHMKKDMSIFTKLRCKTEDVADSLNPINYFEKRKECIRRKDNADTVAIGKRIYKNCMDSN